MSNNKLETTMPDPTEIAVDRIIHLLSKDNENKLATQIVLIATKLNETSPSIGMHKNITEAINFVAHTKTQMERLLK